MPKVIIYTRALYNESVTAQNGGSDEDGQLSLMEMFNSMCKMSLLEYRTALRNIQIKNIEMMEVDNIINSKDSTRKPSFAFVQRNALKELSNLDDDDIVIPLDDDDWLSPDIKKLTFANGITAWNGITLNPFTKKISKRPALVAEENISFERLETLNEKERIEIIPGFIAGCQGYTAKFIKYVINNSTEQIHKLLQRHKQSRNILYQYKKELNLFEKFYRDTHLHVYVKHAGNNSAFKGAKQGTNPEEELKDRIEGIKKGATKVTNYSPEYHWAVPLEKELNELNLSL